jgi:hypothetical protein
MRVPHHQIGMTGLMAPADVRVLAENCGATHVPR